MFKKSYNSVYGLNNNSSFRILFILLTVVFVFYIFTISTSQVQSTNCLQSAENAPLIPFYNSTYPLTKTDRSRNFLRFKIGLIADLDKKSKKFSKDFWISYLLEGYLLYYPSTKKVVVTFENAKSQLRSSLSFGKRGMELSELVVFNGKLYSCDDRTGVVYQIIEQNQTNDELSRVDSSKQNKSTSSIEVVTNNKVFKVLPWVILMDGDGRKEKPFKCEWLAVRNHHLYAGGFGKDWTSPEGVFVNHDPQWVKRISVNGEVEHLNWHSNYVKLMDKVGIKEPGYLIHESAAWSSEHRKWFFLPRKASSKAYNEVEDEKKGTNLMLKSDDNFENIEMITVGESPNPLLGFSSFKFIPGLEDQIIVAIKSKEVGNDISTYVLVFDINGNVLLPETLVDNQIKFEGIEFI